MTHHYDCDQAVQDLAELFDVALSIDEKAVGRLTIHCWECAICCETFFSLIFDGVDGPHPESLRDTVENHEEDL